LPADGLIVEPLNGIVDAILLDPLQQTLQKGDVTERTGCRHFPPAGPFFGMARAQFSFAFVERSNAFDGPGAAGDRADRVLIVGTVHIVVARFLE
jgi:hypothetical protein